MRSLEYGYLWGWNICSTEPVQAIVLFSEKLGDEGESANLMNHNKTAVCQDTREQTIEQYLFWIQFQYNSPQQIITTKNEQL